MFEVICCCCFLIGFMVGFIVHKHEYGEISDKEVFGIKEGEDKNV